MPATRCIRGSPESREKGEETETESIQCRGKELRVIRRLIKEGPFDIDFTLFNGTDLFESSRGQVDRVFISAGRTVILDRDGDGLVGLCVNDLDLLAAKRGFLSRITVTSLVNRGYEITIRVYGPAGTSNSVLKEERGDSA